MIFENIKIKTEQDFDSFPLPRMIKVKQKFDSTYILDIEQETKKQLEIVSAYDWDGKKIGITVGSRGIPGLDKILKIIGEFLITKGANPIMIPSMGSHGGATSEGQIEVLEGYGITEESTGIPFEASMDTEIIGYTKCNTPVHYDKIALNCDGVIVINKVKPHADFKAEYESGIIKMMAIGLGKHNGALALHKRGFAKFGSLLPEVGEIILEKANVIFGLAIVENAYDKPYIIEVIEKQNILSREKELLEIAKEKIARINLKTIDVLIIDEIGKNISGEGMDPNVTGRPGSYLNKGFNAPDIQKIIVRDITDVSNGNGAGVGMADFTTLKLLKKLDFGAMYTNALTATILGPAKIPLIMESDKQAISIAVMSCINIEQKEPKIVRIKNTVELDEIYISEKLLSEIKDSDVFTVLDDNVVLSFDESNNLV